MLNKIFPFMLIGLIIMTIGFVSLVGAQPVYQQSIDVELNLPCTINGALCSPSATCQFSITNPLGQILLNQENMTQVGGLFVYQLNGSQITEVGEYKFPVTCCESGTCSTRHLTFIVTPSGKIGTSGEAITYTILIFVVLTLMTLCIIGAIKINKEHYYDVGGNLLKLSYGKYLKMGLWWLSILFLWFLLFLGWQTAEKILMFAFMVTIFKMLFMILTILIAPSFIAFVVLVIIQWTADLKLWELAERGLSPR